MKYILLFFCLAMPLFCLAQKADDGPQEVTPAMLTKIKADIEKQVNALKARLQKSRADSLSISFAADTFRIEELSRRVMKIDFSTVGMVNATYTAAKQYDALLNKYYKKLMAQLTAPDKQKLIAAQKAWLAFRDAEGGLYTAVNQEIYTTGTMQGPINAGEYEQMIKDRTVMLFGYLQEFSLN